MRLFFAIDRVEQLLSPGRNPNQTGSLVSWIIVELEVAFALQSIHQGLDVLS